MTGLYIRLAAVGVRKNGKSYIPYILTCAVMASVMYIVCFLSNNTLLDRMIGGDMMKSILGVGIVVMAVFSAIFLFYTNSFLIKRRKKEFGLYNILGLKKSQIAKILIWETLLTYALSCVGGLGLGILFSKLAEQLATKMLRGNIDYTFSVDTASVIITLVVFAAIFFVILLNSLRQLFFSRPIQLLRSNSTGEKPPRTNIPFAVIGLLLLGCAYYMAITIKNPVTAIVAFMIAVIMVIIATYLLFIAGSVVMCAALKKNKRYYYQTKHFVSVSQMAYRMRKNGAGLASICILSTMVLVTISSTTTLYFGIQEHVNEIHPTDIEVTVYPKTLEDADRVEETVRGVCAERSITPRNFFDRYQTHPVDEINVALGVDPERDDEPLIYGCCVYAADLFPEDAVKDLDLKDGELAYCEPYSDYMDGRETIAFGNSAEYSLRKIDEHLKIIDQYTRYQNDPQAPDPIVLLFIKDREAMYDLCSKLEDRHIERTFGFDVTEGMTNGEIEDISTAVSDAMVSMIGEEINWGVSSKSDVMGSTYGLYGGLFFLGILLGGVFLLAAVLIMYYKQITEGLEDAARFEILHKVGMSRREIKSTINSQVLTVFFLPLIAAGIHMIFAFVIIARLLKLFIANNSTGLFGIVTLGCYLLFAAVYILVYKSTSVSYSKIVNK